MVQLQYLLNVERPDGNYFPYHYHPCYEIIFYSSGSGSSNYGLCVDSPLQNKFFIFENPPDVQKNMQEISFWQNSLFFYEPYTYHNEKHIQGGRVMVLGFLADSPIKLARHAYHNLTEEAKQYIQRIAGEYAIKKPDYMEAINALLELLIVELKRMNDVKDESQKSLELAKNYIENYYMTKIKIEDIAESCHYTTDHFIRVFGKKYGLCPKQYISKLRLDESLRLLQNTELAIREIGERVGYINNTEFSAFIKKYTGKSPLQIRASDTTSEE